MNTPYVLFVDLNGRKIYMQYLNNSVMAKNILKRIYDNNNFNNLYSTLINKIIKVLGSELAKMHNNNVIHGDLTTSNLLLSYNDIQDCNQVEFNIINNQDFKSLYFIDFGLSYVSSQNEDKAVDLYVLRRAIVSSNPKSEEIV